MIVFSCPRCRVNLQVNDDLAGKQAKCPKCGAMVPILGAVPVPTNPNAPYQRKNPVVAASGARTGKIFISYRREDSTDSTGRIYDRLATHFGTENIVRDVDSIPPGIDFRGYLAKAVQECQILVAVIGRHWLDITNPSGTRRLDDPRDLVRIEVEAALQRNIPVLPVVVQGAAFPDADKLPPTLKELVWRNGQAVRPDPDFHRDMDRLIASLDGLLKEKQPATFSLSGLPASQVPVPMPRAEVRHLAAVKAWETRRAMAAEAAKGVVPQAPQVPVIPESGAIFSDDREDAEGGPSVDDAGSHISEMGKKPKVFISHSTKDREFVETEIIQLLHTHGIETWYSRDNIRTADHWERTILKGLESCDWFLLAMSSNSAGSENVRDEVNWAIAKRDEKIVPVLIEDCDPLRFHLRMLRKQHVNLVRDPEAKKKLLATWGVELRADIAEARESKAPQHVEGNWFYVEDRRKAGPVPLAQLRELVSSGQLTPDEMVLAEGARKWVKAGSVEGLFPARTGEANSARKRDRTIDSEIGLLCVMVLEGNKEAIPFLADRMEHLGNSAAELVGKQKRPNRERKLEMLLHALPEQLCDELACAFAERALLVWAESHPADSLPFRAVALRKSWLSGEKSDEELQTLLSEVREFEEQHWPEGIPPDSPEDWAAYAALCAYKGLVSDGSQMSFDGSLAAGIANIARNVIAPGRVPKNIWANECDSQLDRLRELLPSDDEFVESASVARPRVRELVMQLYNFPVCCDHCGAKQPWRLDAKRQTCEKCGKRFKVV